MSTEENKAIVRRYLDEVWNKGNVNIYDEVMAPTYARYMNTSGAYLDREGQKQRISGIRKAFSELYLVLEDMMAEGEKVTIRVTLHGRHTGNFMGVPATGKEVAIGAIDILRLVDSKVVEHWGVMDTFGLMQQLGVVSPPGQAD
jgi:steroid delta-isomerase-like uncharacterized protein